MEIIQATPDSTAASAPPPAGAPVAAVAAPAHKPRTPGLWGFDVLLYPVFTNIGVCGISMAATYLTARGGDRNAAGKLIYGKTGEFFYKRGEWMVNKFTSAGMSPKQADMAKMVFFSFADGSLLAPVVKLFEDRRERIGCAIDHMLGTKPENLSVYAEEPKQTWLSVLGGRFATAAIVVPTAVALDKTGLNEVLFTKPGLKVGAWLAQKPAVTKLAGTLDVKDLTRIGFFEGFYTSVCTAGLYLSSRFLARRTNRPHASDCNASEPALHCAAADAKPTAAPESEVTIDAPPPAHSSLRRPRTAALKRATGYCDHYTAERNRPSLLLGV